MGTYSDILVAWIPAVAVFAAVMALVGAWRLYERWQLGRSGINDIDRFGGETFERYLEVMFRRLGYRVERTRFVGDYGGDLVLRKNGVRTVVQAKRYAKRAVGVDAVQQVVASKAVYDATESLVVTNSSYTRQAQHLAKKNRVELWDREKLIDALSRTKANRAIPPDSDLARHEDETARSAQANPLADVAVCRTCAKVLTTGERQYCERNARRFGGAMLCFRHQRSAR